MMRMMVRSIIKMSRRRRRVVGMARHSLRNHRRR
jgi:hypothetical protein